MSKLKFEVEWSQSNDSDPRLANTAAELVLLINDVPASRLLDIWSKTVTDRGRLPMYPLAEWFAVNWWRLHAEAPFESGAPPPAVWRMAHDLGAVGGGGIRLATSSLCIRWHGDAGIRESLAECTLGTGAAPQ